MRCIIYTMMPFLAGAFVASLPRGGGDTTNQLFMSSFGKMELAVNKSAVAVESLVGPPSPLKELRIGESYNPFDPLEITKVSHDPPIFVMRNFLPQRERRTIMDAAEINLRTAKTLTGSVQHRVGSSLTWIDGSGDGDEEQHAIAEFMTQLSAHLFLDDSVAESVNAEPLQVVKYDQAGSFDLHTDGCGRTVTVLTYLNGIAGTWFPLVGASNAEGCSMKLKNKASLEGKIPGVHGLVVAGDEQPGMEESDNVVRVQAGDAVVFYNYENDPRLGKVPSWKSLHSGLKAMDTKWIATNWLGTKSADSS